jgi:hypothetical protein
MSSAFSILRGAVFKDGVTLIVTKTIINAKSESINNVAVVDRE